MVSRKVASMCCCGSCWLTTVKLVSIAIIWRLLGYGKGSPHLKDAGIQFLDHKKGGLHCFYLNFQDEIDAKTKTLETHGCLKKNTRSIVTKPVYEHSGFWVTRHFCFTCIVDVCMQHTTWRKTLLHLLPTLKSFFFWGGRIGIFWSVWSSWARNWRLPISCDMYLSPLKFYQCCHLFLWYHPC